MKLLSLAVLAMASTAVAEQEFTMGMTITFDGLSGNPNNKNCIEIFQDTIVAAYATAMPDADDQLKALTVNNMAPGFANALMGRWMYNASGTYWCR
jgi:uncharacterized protein (DUF2141 family)